MQMFKALVAGIVSISLLAGCDTVNDETVKDMPTGYLCSMLDPNTWITSLSVVI